MASKHAIIQCELTRFIVAEDVLKKELESSVAFVLDLKKENIEELLCTGETEAINFMGHKKKVTIEYCDCANMASHKQNL